MSKKRNGKPKVPVIADSGKLKGSDGETDKPRPIKEAPARAHPPAGGRWRRVGIMWVQTKEES